MELSDVSSSAGEYIPAVLFLLASGLLLPFLYLVLTSMDWLDNVSNSAARAARAYRRRKVSGHERNV